MSETKKHFYYVDLIRIISFLSIILIHVSAAPFGRYDTISYRDWMVSMFLSYSVRFATPMFIMISGYLLLNSLDTKNTKDFFLKRAKKIIPPLLFWNLFYFAFNVYMQKSSAGWSDFWRGISSEGTYYHLYFLYLISGLYLISPLLKKLLNRGLNLNYAVPLLLLLSYLYQIGSTFWAWPKLTNWPFLFILYIGYYLSGIWVSQWKFKRRPIMFLLIPISITIAVFASRYMVSLFGIDDRGMIFAHRLSPFVALPSLLIFYLLIGVSNEFLQRFNPRILRSIADLSMGVYLVHPLFIGIFSALDPASILLNSYPLRWLLFTYPATVICSIVSVRHFKRLPLLRAVV